MIKNLQIKKWLFLSGFLGVSLLSHAQVSFIADKTEICAPAKVNFTNTSTLGNYFEWQAPCQQPVISHDFSANYTNCYGSVNLTAFDTTGGQMNYVGSYSMEIIIREHNNIYISPKKICPGEEVSFSTNRDNTLWQFGDMTTYEGDYVDHTYNTPGTYIVTVQGENQCGAYEYKDTILVSTSTVPEADYNLRHMQPKEFCPGEQLDLYVSGNSSNKTYSWTFGDMTTASGSQVTKKYTQAGTYPITLTVKNICNNTATLKDTFYIKNNVALQNLQFSVDNGSPMCPNTEMYYSANRRYASYLWNFGDGTTSTKSEGRHIYTTLGKHKVTLTASNLCGSTRTDSSHNRSEVVNDLEIDETSVSLEIEPRIACPGSPVFFEAYGQDITSYQWSLGDGINKNDEYFQHTFNSEGTKTISLILKNGCGNSLTVVDSVKLKNDAPVDIQDFDVSQEVACIGDKIFFYSSGGKNYVFNFGDGTTTTETTPLEVEEGYFVDVAEHAYNQPGTYKVSLKYYNACGNFASDTIEIVVRSSANPSTDIDADVDQYSEGTTCKPTKFIATGGNKFEWNFGDGTETKITTDGILSHQYKQAGFYVVTVKVTNGCNQTVEAIDEIDITDNCIVTSVTSSFTNSLSVFPNPVTERGTIGFEIDKTMEMEISLVDISGRKTQVFKGVKPSGKNEIELNPETLQISGGLYIINIATSEGNYSQKVSISK